jgi:hypothetical protein
MTDRHHGSNGCASAAGKVHPKASILKGSRVVFNIKASDYRLVASVQYENGVMMNRLFRIARVAQDLLQPS